ALDPHVDHLDAENALHNTVEVVEDVLHQFVTLAGYHLVEGTGAKLVAQSTVDPGRQAVVGNALVTARGPVVGTDIDDPPFDVGIHQKALAFDGKKALRRGIKGQYPGIKLADLVHQRHLDMQTRGNVLGDQLTEPQLDRPLGFLHHVETVARQDQQQGDNDDQAGKTGIH